MVAARAGTGQQSRHRLVKLALRQDAVAASSSDSRKSAAPMSWAGGAGKADALGLCYRVSICDMLGA